MSAPANAWRTGTRRGIDIAKCDRENPAKIDQTVAADSRSSGTVNSCDGGDHMKWKRVADGLLTLAGILLLIAPTFDLLDWRNLRRRGLFCGIAVLEQYVD
jgi:hypothetical protein